MREWKGFFGCVFLVKGETALRETETAMYNIFKVFLLTFLE